MIFIFGWVKEHKPVATLNACYCYGCQRDRVWEHWRESEWVSFFTVKTIPFIWKNRIVCTGCKDAIIPAGDDLTKFREGGSKTAAEAVVQAHQFKNKTDVQQRYLLAARNERRH